MHKLQHCLGERGKGGKIKADRVNCPKNFVLHCRSKSGIKLFSKNYCLNCIVNNFFVCFLNPPQFLRVVVRKSLEEVDKLKGTSIGFLAIGTGKLEFPPAEAARIMLDETIRFFGEYPATTVRDVRFILLRKNDKVIDAFTQELNRQQETFGENEEQKHIASPGIQSGCRRSIKTQHINVEVVHGDLTNEESDAIVNIINSDMDMENAGEVSKAIPRGVR